MIVLIDVCTYSCSAGRQIQILETVSCFQVALRRKSTGIAMSTWPLGF